MRNNRGIISKIKNYTKFILFIDKNLCRFICCYYIQVGSTISGYFVGLIRYESYAKNILKKHTYK